MKGFYIHKSANNANAYFFRIGIRIEKFLCQPNLETPLANMYTEETTTRVMYLQNSLSEYNTDCAANLMTFTNLVPSGVANSNYSLTINAGITAGLKTFNVVYTNKIGVVTTVPISFTVIWRPVNGPNYYPSNGGTANIVNVDTDAVTCVLTQVTACRDSGNFLRVVKFTFTPASCH